MMTIKFTTVDGADREGAVVAFLPSDSCVSAVVICEDDTLCTVTLPHIHASDIKAVAMTPQAVYDPTGGMPS